MKPYLILLTFLLSLATLCAENKFRAFDLVISDRESGASIPAGTFRLGIGKGDASRWCDEMKDVDIKQTDSTFTYTLRDELLGKGTLTVRVATLSTTQGIVLEVEGIDLVDIRLLWTFTGNPYPVYSVERTAFTVYFGESMRLRTYQGITPFGSEIRLSGKKTDTPYLSAVCPITSGEKLYFCFYQQNREADYNYYLLPALFNRQYIIP